MKKICLSMLLTMLFIPASYAIPTNDIPDTFYVTEHYMSLTTSYDVETRTQKFGTLYRRFMSMLLTYDFYDPFGNPLAYARSRFFSFTAHFDIFDIQNRPLGIVEEQYTLFFPTFDIYGSDGYNKKARAEMNFWGTRFDIYDVATNELMAEMSRPFFRLKNNWTINIKNRALFNARDIDPRLFMIVLAFQGDIEEWKREDAERRRDQDDKHYMKARSVSGAKEKAPDPMIAAIKTIKDQIAEIMSAQGFDAKPTIDKAALETLANQLQAEFDKTQTVNNETETNVEKVNDFSVFCLNKALSSATPPSEKAAILFLLQSRLEGTNAPKE